MISLLAFDSEKVSEGFRADVGYIRQAAYKEANFWTRKAFRFDSTIRLN